MLQLAENLLLSLLQTRRDENEKMRVTVRHVVDGKCMQI